MSSTRLVDSSERRAVSSTSIAGEVVVPPRYRASVGRHDLVWFVLLVSIAHAITYFVVGALAFAMLTHELYEGVDPLLGTYLRTPGETQLWQHVTTWFLPAQLLRGALIGLALSPFLQALRGWSVGLRAIAIAGLYLVIGFWAAAVAAPGNIEGLVYLRPEYSLDVVLLVQPEIIVQGAAMAIIVALGLQRL
jgi:hypothetical protein